MSNSVDICPFDDDLTCPLDYHTCEIYRERMNDANSQIAAKDARIDLLDSDQKRYHAAWMAAEEDKEEQAARIKELEEANRNIDKRRDEMAAFIERLEAAFLDHLAARLYYEHYPGVSDAYSWHDYPEDACQMRPKEMFRQKAREALERIKEEREG